MTANSIELLPCQVAPLGVRHRIHGRVAPVAATAPKLSAKCNLFGSPAYGEINQIFKRENQENRDRLFNRYNFDVRNEAEAGTNAVQQPSSLDENEEAVSSTSGERQPMHSLIECEMQQHEQRLLAGKCKQLVGIGAVDKPAAAVVVAPIKRTVLLPTSSSTLEIGAANDRSKPYARQMPITDCFNKRKTSKQQPPRNGERLAQRKLEVLQQFPKSAAAAAITSTSGTVATSYNNTSAAISSSSSSSATTAAAAATSLQSFTTATEPSCESSNHNNNNDISSSSSSSSNSSLCCRSNVGVVDSTSQA